MSTTIPVPGMTRVYGVRLTSAFGTMKGLPDAMPVFITDGPTCVNINAGGFRVVRNDTGAEIPAYALSTSDTLCVLIVEIPGGSTNFAVTIGSSATASRPTLKDRGVSLALPDGATFPDGTFPNFPARKIAASPAGDGDVLTTPRWVHPAIFRVRPTDADWIKDLHSDGPGACQYVCVNTPYPSNNDDYENPVMLVRNDTIGDWERVGRNPLLDWPGGSDFNFDCSVAAFAASGTGSRDRIRVTIGTTTGGANPKYADFDSLTGGSSPLDNPPTFSTPTYDDSTANTVSPSQWWEEGHGWWSLLVEVSTTGVPGKLRLYKGNADGSSWARQADIAVAGRNISWWHGHIRYMPSIDRWWVIVSETNENNSKAFNRKRAVIFESSSSDLNTATWTRYRYPVIDMTASTPTYQNLHGVYCPAVDEDGSGNALLVWAGAKNNGSGSPLYSTIELASTVAAIRAPVSVDPSVEADARAFFRLGVTSNNDNTAPEDPFDIGLVAHFDFTKSDGTAGSAGDSPTYRTVLESGFTWADGVGLTNSGTSGAHRFSMERISDSAKYRLSGLLDHVIVAEIYCEPSGGIIFFGQGVSFTGINYAAYGLVSSGAGFTWTGRANTGSGLMDADSPSGLVFNTVDTTNTLATYMNSNFLQLSNQTRKTAFRNFGNGSAATNEFAQSGAQSYFDSGDRLIFGNRFDLFSYTAQRTFRRITIFQPDKSFTSRFWNWVYDDESSEQASAGGRRSRMERTARTLRTFNL